MSEAPCPSLWQVMTVDPASAIDPATLGLVIQDQRRRSRLLIYPLARIVSRLAVAAVTAAKRACPFQFTAHAAMDRMCLWFLRHFVSPAAVTLLIRHFIVEANLLNFCVRNAGVPGLAESGLRPTTLAGLGNRAVIDHDLNVYRVLFALGLAGASGPREQADLDFSMLDVPPINPEPEARRLTSLDIQTALCFMNIPFAFCLTTGEYRQAVHSMRLDTSLLTVLAALTCDSTFHLWRPDSILVRVDSNVDVPRMVYEHAVRCEYAHARLCRLRDAARARAANGGARSGVQVGEDGQHAPVVIL